MRRSILQYLHEEGIYNYNILVELYSLFLLLSRTNNRVPYTNVLASAATRGHSADVLRAAIAEHELVVCRQILT
jgi:hypothetical protein